MACTWGYKGVEAGETLSGDNSNYIPTFFFFLNLNIRFRILI